MDIIVCVKRVPDVSEIDVDIAPDKKDIKKDDLIFDLNEWDRYALEEAVLLKERFEGKVTVITIGDEQSEETLRKCLAMGADNAVRIYDENIKGSDPYVIARLLHSFIKDRRFDLILTGVQAGDDGYGQVGGILSGMLNIPHASMVTHLEAEGENILIHRELEGGMEEKIKLSLPALLAIQTGINEPRYVSIMGIRKASRLSVELLDHKSLNLRDEDVGEAGSRIKVEEIYFPEATKETKMLTGTPSEMAEEVFDILKEKGGLA
ncbi:MAG: electron transfer flavoprotein subunit beta/FixA family protein [Thermodesulfobacteriota bacterium]|nr:electron transfer flavoprotein subunit beta/FixA family protein [Thermodesulfobacteriota bacterium]